MQVYFATIVELDNENISQFQKEEPKVDTKTAEPKPEKVRTLNSPFSKTLLTNHYTVKYTYIEWQQYF